MKKLLIIGLDCFTPQLVFDQWKNKLPNLNKLIVQGVWGKLESTIPPITCPAWAVMTSGYDPGRLGVYGFRHRIPGTYHDVWIANNTAIKEKRVWDILGEKGLKSIILGVPQTYPPKPLNGLMVTGFLAPDIKSQYTYPNDLKKEIEEVVGEYILDVKEFRTENKKWLLEQIYKMTEKRFKLARHFIKTKDWDFFMMVEMGPDRIHHGFWKYFDKEHKKYSPGNEFEDAVLNYYKYIDNEIGKILSLLDQDTAVMIVSDHGAKKMDGCICINEWLIKKGWLKLKKYPEKIIKLEEADIDWSATKAWAWGGYYAHVFLNIKDREPEGIIERRDFEKERKILAEEIRKIPDEKGNPLNHKVWAPEEIYPEVRGEVSDLIVFFDNLSRRAVGTIGYKTVHTFENDTGPDDAEHDWHGIYIFYDPKKNLHKEIKKAKIIDITPTILNYFKIKSPASLKGKILI